MINPIFGQLLLHLKLILRRMFSLRKSCFLTCILTLSLLRTANATQGAWSAGINFPGISRAHYFQWVINGKGYMGTGSYVAGSNLTFSRDVWEFDPVANTWSQKADFGGNIRTGTLNFTVGSFGYAGCGADQFAVYNDFWQFDPVANTWTQIAYFPGTPRVYGHGFGMDTVGFAGMGRTFTAAGSTVTYNDLYEYNPNSNTWTAKNNFPGTTRSFASTFRIGNFNYLLAGQSGNPTNQLWQYDASADTWASKSSFPAGNRIGMTTLVIQDTAYAGLGRSQDPVSGVTTYFNDFWMYDAINDTWTRYTDLPAALRFRAYGFGIDSLGYVGCGENVATTYNDSWIFNPRLTTTGVGLNETAIENLSFYYNSQLSLLTLKELSGNYAWTLTLYTSNGQQVYSTRIRNAQQFELAVNEFAAGMYILNADNGVAQKAFRFVK